MASKIRRIEYFHMTVKDEPGEAYRLLSRLADVGVNLLAFTSVPTGPTHTQLTLFPDDTGKLEMEARRARIKLTGPNPAILVQGNDQLGVLADIHERLFSVGVNVYASSAVSDGVGQFGYILYIRPEQFDKAARSLKI